MAGNFQHQAATCNFDENLAQLLGLDISKPFYLNGRPGINVRCEMFQILWNHCTRSNGSNWRILVSPILSPNGCPSNLTTLPPSDGREKRMAGKIAKISINSSSHQETHLGSRAQPDSKEIAKIWNSRKVARTNTF